MKLTKKQLKKIIKEELGAATENSRIEDAVARIEKELNVLWNNGVTNEELISILETMTGHVKSGFIGEPT